MNELMLAVVESKDRKAMAGVYARYLDANDVDWGAVNAAILTRWSMSGLQYIKTLAWKIRGQVEWGTWSSTLILAVNVVQAVIGGAVLALTLDVWRRSRR